MAKGLADKICKWKRKKRENGFCSLDEWVPKIHGFPIMYAWEARHDFNDELPSYAKMSKPLNPSSNQSERNNMVKRTVD